MTPRELMRLEPVRVSDWIEEATRHMPEVDSLLPEPDQDPRIQVRYYADHQFDSDRNFQVGAVFFDERPVLVFRDAGRWKDSEHYGVWVVDPEVYWALAKYVFDLPRHENDLPYPERAGIDEDLGDEMTHFYSTSLDEVRGSG